MALLSLREAVSAAEGNAFARRLEAAVRRVEGHEAGAVRDLRRLMTALRRDIVAELASADAEQAMGLHRLLGAMESALADFVSRGTGMLTDAQRAAWGIAEESLQVGVRAAGLDVELPAVAVHQLATLTGYSTDLIHGLAQDVRAKVAPVIRQAAAGILTPQQAIARVGATIDKGAFASAAARGEAIVRTDVLRTYSVATASEFDRAEEAGVVFERRWNATEDARTRPAHAAADGQVRGTQGYHVGGEVLQYPRDPRGSAANTIQCRCVERSRVLGLKA